MLTTIDENLPSPYTIQAYDTAFDTYDYRASHDTKNSAEHCWGPSGVTNGVYTWTRLTQIGLILALILLIYYTIKDN